MAAAALCSVGLCRADHAVFTKVSPEQGGFFSLFGEQQQRIEAHFFHEADMSLCIVDEGPGKPRYGSLEAAMKRECCVAGVNGGYFGADAERTPLGLVRHAGKAVTPLSTKGFTVAGLLYDTGRGIRLERSSRLSAPVSAMREAIQGGPFLVEQGRVVPGLEKTKKAARTFVASDGAGRWCLAITSPLTLHELACWLSEPSCMGEFRVRVALNLDGGSSSAFWDKAAGVYMPGFKAVRNYVGVRPRALSGASSASGNKRSAK